MLIIDSYANHAHHQCYNTPDKWIRCVVLEGAVRAVCCNLHLIADNLTIAHAYPFLCQMTVLCLFLHSSLSDAVYLYLSLHSFLR